MYILCSGCVSGLWWLWECTWASCSTILYTWLHTINCILILDCTWSISSPFLHMKYEIAPSLIEPLSTTCFTWIFFINDTWNHSSSFTSYVLTVPIIIGIYLHTLGSALTLLRALVKMAEGLSDKKNSLPIDHRRNPATAKPPKITKR